MENTQEKDLNPYEFTLEIDGEPHAVRVEVPKDGDYIIYINGERTGHITSTNSSGKRSWTSKDDIAQSLIDQVGAQIEVLEAADIH
ncbi:MAG: hypothetical protein EOP48_07450 [Sphingobacteriales bacterium]|nr:MAG: hypothetical protein EOP48_07450 [Sphingobacteriales bacterium]